MSTIRTAWAAWHPVKGFDEYIQEGPVAFAVRVAIARVAI